MHASTTTKNDLVETICRELDRPKKDVQDAVEAIFELIRSELSQGNDVKLSRFGNFIVRSKSSRPGRNPKTGEEKEIPARKVVSFKPSTALKNRVIQVNK